LIGVDNMRYYSTKYLLKKFPEIIVEDEGRWNEEDEENTYYVQIFSFLEENNIDKEDCPLEGDGHWARNKDNLRYKVNICANFINEIKTKIKPKLGDKFIIEHGANQHGKGKALFKLTKITKNGNLYGLKTSLDGKRIFNKNHKLNTDTLIRPA
tara:strand:+ start:926 stop:1387 length:462 start_codon:yes stop_codon:yes gene_type:complete